MQQHVLPFRPLAFPVIARMRDLPPLAPLAHSFARREACFSSPVFRRTVCTLPTVAMPLGRMEYSRVSQAPRKLVLTLSFITFSQRLITRSDDL